MDYWSLGGEATEVIPAPDERSRTVCAKISCDLAQAIEDDETNVAGLRDLSLRFCANRP
jgi:hypothetical protein